MGLRPCVLVVPSRAAALELPRRLASTGRAVAGLYAFTLPDLAVAIAEPVLLGRGLRAWNAGHDALLAGRLLDEHRSAQPARGEGPRPVLKALRRLEELPRGPVAAALARTLSSLRRAGVPPSHLEKVQRAAATAEDADRLAAVDSLYRRYHEVVEGRFADGAMLLRGARECLTKTRWLLGAEVLVVDEGELAPLEVDLLEALERCVPVRVLRRERPPGLERQPAAFQGLPSAAWAETPLAPIAPAAPPEGLRRLRASLFEPPSGAPVRDGSVELVTAAGEASEARAVLRRLLREAARGVPFEDMGVILARPEPYAPLFTDLLERLGIPYRLHPSLPLRHGRAARSLLLLFRCRGLTRAAVMEFLTFAPVPFAEILGDDVPARLAQWEATSRDAGIVSSLERWIIGLRAYAEAAREQAEAQEDAERRERSLSRAGDAEALLRVVELLSASLDSLSGQATWPEWSTRLGGIFDQWVGKERDRGAVVDVIADLAGLDSLAEGAPVSWDEVEAVLETRFEWERLPLTPLATGAIHVGAMDALAGLPFRVVAIPGLVEGGYPGVLRPDPFLLDSERDALAVLQAPGEAEEKRRGQLSLFQSLPPLPLPPHVGGGKRSTPDGPAEAAGTASPSRRRPLPTTQDRLLEARRDFHAAISCATERLILSYPRASPRTGRERLPSLFFAAAASALAGRPLGAAELAAAIVEDGPGTLPLEDTLDAGERDLARVLRGGSEAALAVAAGCSFFKWSHVAAHDRWSARLTRFDGLVDALPPDAARLLDPTTAPWPVSASSLANYATCGFLYFLKNVLRLDAAEDPEERLWLEPREQGLLFHEVAEDFLRERRDQGRLPVRDDEPSRQRLLEMAGERVSRMVAGTPPRHRLVWEMRWRAFEEMLLRWLTREASTAETWTPAHFEVRFGSPRREATREPHTPEPLIIDLDDGRQLRVSGKIDRIDTDAEGALVLRDYKTGRAPKDEGGVFRGGRELQIPIYVLAAQMLWPGRGVTAAFLDYVNGGRPVAFDPESVAGEEFRSLLREMVDAIAEGSFVQEPASCRFCDYTSVCGPQPLLEIRRGIKKADPRVARYARLRDYR